MTPTVLVLSTSAQLFETSARRFTAAVGEAIEARGTAHVALAGGSTPAGLYERLSQPESRARFDWKRIHIWWSDERAVPPDDAASNYGMARDSLLRHLDLQPGQVHRMVASPASLEASARRHEEEVRGAVPMEGEWPRYDLVMLGIGADGHTASLFPHHPELAVVDRLVAPVMNAPQWPRLTLTLPVINAARNVIVLGAGITKARAVARALTGEPGPDCPASLVRPDPGHLLWIIDEEANRIRGGSLPWE